MRPCIILEAARLSTLNRAGTDFTHPINGNHELVAFVSNPTALAGVLIELVFRSPIPHPLTPHISQNVMAGREQPLHFGYSRVITILKITL